MAYLSIGEIPKLKELIKPYGYTVHISDACGGQAFRLEAISDTTCDKVYEIIKDFFALHKMIVKFLGNDKLEFIAK